MSYQAIFKLARSFNIVRPEHGNDSLLGHYRKLHVKCIDALDAVLHWNAMREERKI